MYAVVEIAGQQTKVQKAQVITAPKLAGELGDSVVFDRVLLVAGDGDAKIGTPIVEGFSVKATIIEHFRDKKVIVFKKKRRKTYEVKRGHRQEYTKIKIEEIA